MLSRLALLVALVVAAACGAGDSSSVAGTVPSTAGSSTPPAESTTILPAETTAPSPFNPPDWLGTRVLPTDPSTGFGEVQPTPSELADRRYQQDDLLPPPTTDGFVASVVAVPDDVAARSTWDPACPVALTDLRYVTLPFWGFDGQRHTGELLVHADAADVIVAAFEQLHAERFPIEEMRIIRTDELDLPPTGDGNNTTAFVCRPVVGTTTWSQHAYGRAVDVNPFHNPYVKGEVVLPELASAYLDRTALRPGMLLDGTAEVGGFTDLGWGWGGHWRSLKDYMHFSANGR